MSQSQSSSLVWSAVIAVVIHAALWGFLFFELVIYLPDYVRIFDFQIRLPTITEGVVAVAVWANYYLYLLVLLPAADALFLVLLYRRGSNTGLWLWTGVLVGLVLFVTLAVDVGVWLAVEKMRQALVR
jgi:type II secretory pathway component PulF